MTVTQLRNQLHTIIDKLEDANFLKMLLSFTQKNVGAIENFKKQIEKGETDIKSGKTHTQDEVENYFKRKLERRNV